MTPAQLKRIDLPDEKARKAGLSPECILKADTDGGRIIVDSETTLTGIPPEAWDYRLGNRCALEWILDQYKEKRNPSWRRANDRSRRAAVYNLAAPRFMREMPKPTIRSGQADRVTIVFRPAAMMPIFASASFRAERNADCVKLPLWARKRARRRAQTRFTASPPPPANDNGTGAGGSGATNLSQAVHSVAKPRASKIAARTIPV